MSLDNSDAVDDRQQQNDSQLKLLGTTVMVMTKIMVLISGGDEVLVMVWVTPTVLIMLLYQVSGNQPTSW